MTIWRDDSFSSGSRIPVGAFVFLHAWAWSCGEQSDDVHDDINTGQAKPDTRDWEHLHHQLNEAHFRLKRRRGLKASHVVHSEHDVIRFASRNECRHKINLLTRASRTWFRALIEDVIHLSLELWVRVHRVLRHDARRQRTRESGGEWWQVKFVGRFLIHADVDAMILWLEFDASRERCIELWKVSTVGWVRCFK